MSQLIVTMYVAENPGINLIELCKLANMTMPTVSKVARSLSIAGAEYTRPPAFGLIEVKRNPIDGRGRTLNLSKAGKEFCAVLDRLIAIGTPIQGDRDLTRDVAGDASLMLKLQK